MSIISTLIKKRTPVAEEEAGEKEMSFLDHLEELRWHLLRTAGVIVIFAVGLFIQIPWLLHSVILGPFNAEFPTHKFLCGLQKSLCFDKIDVQLIAIDPYEQFVKSITISLIGGFVLAFPYFIWEMWRFIKPGLHPAERKGMGGSVLIISLLFFLGTAFAYYVIAPFSVTFLAGYKLAPEIANQWKIGDVISMIIQISVGGGIVFQMPVLAYFLSRIGILTPAFMRQYRRHAIVVLLVVAALITPPDWISQILIFLPLQLLYEISIRISGVAMRQRERDIAKALA
ncbi:MAG: twin-arginine translocase subunit TatC [Bacteroidia bacterium]|nr:twin-arginine translocase subunit TatC [Bacteroidia bacterium]